MLLTVTIRYRMLKTAEEVRNAFATRLPTENNIRSGVGGNNYGLNNDYSRMTSGVGNGSSGRLFQGSQQGHRMNTLNALEQNTTGEADHKAEKYQNIVKDLKKKYTRSRTEVSCVIMYLGCCDLMEVFKCLCCNAAFE